MNNTPVWIGVVLLCMILMQAWCIFDLNWRLAWVEGYMNGALHMEHRR